MAPKVRKFSPNTRHSDFPSILLQAHAREHFIIGFNCFTNAGNPSKIIHDVHENMKYPSSKFPLTNSSKPTLKLGQIFLSSTIQHFRKDEPKELKQMPSVTKILKETMSVENKLKLQIWEEKMIAKMGREAFEKMKELTFKRGHRLHNAIGALIYFLKYR